VTITIKSLKIRAEEVKNSNPARKEVAEKSLRHPEEINFLLFVN
jgi:hypothetical protein